MNEQKAPYGIEWTRVWGRRGYTWNPVGGCHHDCQWDMPDGSTAICYAKEVADRMRDDRFYQHGFEHNYFHPERLAEPAAKKEPSGIFLDSMSDLLAANVPDEQIEAVLNAAASAPQHVFQLLTKNPPRLLKFKFPENIWLGVSMPPTRLMGTTMDENRQARWMDRALDVLAQISGNIRWLSLEPLSFDVNQIIGPRANPPIDWVVIGAASNGRKLYQPRPEWVHGLLQTFDFNRTPVFFKGNLDWPRTEWRAAFPPEPIRYIGGPFNGPA
jgi:protein gp37